MHLLCPSVSFSDLTSPYLISVISVMDNKNHDAKINKACCVRLLIQFRGSHSSLNLSEHLQIPWSSPPSRPFHIIYHSRAEHTHEMTHPNNRDLRKRANSGILSNVFSFCLAGDWRICGQRYRWSRRGAFHITTLPL